MGPSTPAPVSSRRGLSTYTASSGTIGHDRDCPAFLYVPARPRPGEGPLSAVGLPLERPLASSSAPPPPTPAPPPAATSAWTCLQGLLLLRRSRTRCRRGLPAQERAQSRYRRDREMSYASGSSLSPTLDWRRPQMKPTRDGRHAWDSLQCMKTSPLLPAASSPALRSLQKLRPRSLCPSDVPVALQAPRHFCCYRGVSLQH